MLTKAGMKKIILIVLIAIMFGSLYFPSYASTILPNTDNAKAIHVPQGYKVEVYATHLSVPTTAIFDGTDLIVAESGAEKTAKPRVIRVKPDGQQQTLASEGLIAPVTGLLMIKGKLYISHETKVSYVENGVLHDVVTGLPSFGDHENNKIILGPDGRIYIGQGTVTNSGVVGVDSYVFGWLSKHPTAHDIPCQDIMLNGENFTTNSPLSSPSGKVTTGAYHSYGQPSTPGEIINGDTKCNGSILSFNPDGSDLKVVAWGMRNPFGVQFDANGQLWTTFHGADERGSRNIANDPDYLIKVQQGAWYGWPDYFDNGKPADQMSDPIKPQAHLLWKDHPTLSLPYLTLEPHGASNGLAFSPGGSFGFGGQAFVAEFGTYSILTSGANLALPGFKVSRIDLSTKKVEDFVSNILPGAGYMNQSGGLNRPTDVLFGPDQSMYITDWGASTIGTEGLKYAPETGTIWRVYSSLEKPLRSQGPIVINSYGAKVPDGQREAQVLNKPALYAMLAPQVIVLVVFVLGIVLSLIVIAVLRKHHSAK